MQLGFIGLGKMGINMVTRLAKGGHHVVAHDRDAGVADASARVGATPSHGIAALVAALEPPRAVWVMVPAGAPTESVVTQLADVLAPGDTILDGGNTNFHDDVRRAHGLHARGLSYLDVGTSGGIWGLELGYCLMIGGPKPAFERLEPIFRTLAPEGGYAYVGGPGAGHFVKMVHNGIEYGLMQAYAEGFELMHQSDYALDLPRIADLWGRGSVVRSWLLELAARALAADPALGGVRGVVQDSGEGRWTIEEGIARGVPLPAMTAALYARFASREDNAFADRLLAALRQQFGGHAVTPARPAE